MKTRRPRVLVAMSGGVDSSVTAALIKELKYDVVGVTMQIWPSNKNAEDTERFGGCCSLGAVADAKKVAFKIGIPHYVLNFRKVFEEKVINNFCQEYLAGRTPNPCVRCNEHIKFDVLLKKARELEADFIATGHYARIDQENGKFRLKKGVDARKDQSYVLYMMKQDTLRQTLMPLGNLTKNETRQIAKNLGLPVAEKEESQEICFVSDGNYGKFLEDYLDKSPQPGPILNLGGEIVGKHRGLIFYTVGQRRGLGISGRESLYVIAIDRERNALLVGPEDKTYSSQFRVEEARYVDKPLASPTKLKVKIRYQSEEAEAVVTPENRDKALVELETPQKAVTPGQAAVFYKDELVVGGGTIRFNFSSGSIESNT